MLIKRATYEEKKRKKKGRKGKKKTQIHLNIYANRNARKISIEAILFIEINRKKSYQCKNIVAFFQIYSKIEFNILNIEIDVPLFPVKL